MRSPLCDEGHAMRLEQTFRFDHEHGDDPRVTEALALFQERGIELGANVTMWYCEACDVARYEFDYREAEA